MIGVQDQLPLMWILVGAAVTFASTAVGLAGYRNYIFQKNPEHKLAFARPLVSRGGNLINIGFEIRNDAVFPIEVRIEALSTSCSHRITELNGIIKGAQFVLSPGETKFCHAAGINIEGIAEPLLLGRIEVSLAYGHPKSLRCSMSKNLNLFIPHDAGMPFQWNDHLINKPGQSKMVTADV